MEHFAWRPLAFGPSDPQPQRMRLSLSQSGFSSAPAKSLLHTDRRATTAIHKNP